MYSVGNRRSGEECGGGEWGRVRGAVKSVGSGKEGGEWWRLWGVAEIGRKCTKI